MDAKDAKKAAYTHDCNDCVFLGHYTQCYSINYMTFNDLYLCPNTPTLTARFGNGESDYISGNNAEFFAHIPALALAAELAIRWLFDERMRLNSQ